MEESEVYVQENGCLPIYRQEYTQYIVRTPSVGCLSINKDTDGVELCNILSHCLPVQQPSLLTPADCAPQGFIAVFFCIMLTTTDVLLATETMGNTKQEY